MEIVYKTRAFYPDELRILKTVRKSQSKKTCRFTVYHYILSIVTGFLFTYIATLVKDTFWVFPTGTIAVFAFVVVVFAPSEIYKEKKKHKEFIKDLDEYILNGTVETFEVKAKRVAFAAEYEDENDIYLIDLGNEQVLYLWDRNYNLNKKLPCLHFEIYEEDLFKLLGRQIYTRSERVEPILIDKKAKWDYMGKIGIPHHLAIETKNFDKLIEDIRSFNVKSEKK